MPAGSIAPAPRGDSAASAAGVRSRLVDPAHLPYPVVVAGAWSGLIIVIAAAAYLVVQAIQAVTIIVVPLAVAVLLAALLQPLVRWLTEHTPLPRWMSSLVALIVLLTVVGAGTTIAVSQIASGASQMASGVQAGVDAITTWLSTGPLHITGGQLSAYINQAQDALRAHASDLSTRAIDLGSRALEIFAGTIVCLIATFFYLYQGRTIWTFAVILLPRAARRPVFEAARRGWESLSAYARTQVVVAAVDAIGIAFGAFLLGLPLVGPILMLVFLCSFIPIVGAVVAGAVPTLIALVVNGPVSALLMLGVILLVQQVEAHALQPFLMGRAVSLHPLAVIVAVTMGGYLFSIPGALFAVPVLAFVNAASRYLTGYDPFPELGQAPAADARCGAP